MKKLVAFLTLAVGIFTLARADETPHLKFVERLRDKQYSDLALEYLNLLEKEAPPEVAAFIPIERASIHLARAQQATNPADRARYYDLARAGFDAFIKNSKAKSPGLAAIAQLKSSRILGLQGRSRLTRTRQLRDAALTAEMTRILGMFEDANVQLEGAGAAIDKQLRVKNPEKMAAALEQARLEADLELALNQLDQGLTYQALQKDAQERNKKIDAAIKQLNDLYGRDPKGALGLQARAWVIKCNLEFDQVSDAKKIYDKLMDDKFAKGSQGDVARRMAQFFYIQMLRSDNVTAVKTVIKAKTDEDVQKEVQRACREWLRQYPSHINSYEGNTARFELANSIRAQGDAIPKIGAEKDQLAAKAKPFIEEALQLYEALAESETEYAPEVNHFLYRCRYELSTDSTAEVKPGDARKIMDFPLAVSAAKRLGFTNAKEWDQLRQLQAKKNRKTDEDAKLAKLEKERPQREKQLMKGVEECLLRALELVQLGKAAKVKPKEILEAHANLAWVLMNNGDQHRSVVVGEHAAHMPAVDGAEAKQAAQAAAWALQSYAQLISKGTKEGYPKEMVDSDRERFRRLVDFMETTWKDDPSTDSARHQLGSQMLADKDFKGAEDVLSRVSNRYNADGLIDARRRWCIACIELGKEAKTDAERKKYRDNSIKALKSVPELTANSDAGTAVAYVSCKILLGSILFQSKEYTELERLAKALKAQIPALKIDAENKDYLTRQADNLLHYAKYGRAHEELEKGNYGKALTMADEALKPVSEAVRKVRARQGKLRKQFIALEEEAETAKTLGKTLDKAKTDLMEELRGQVEELNQAVARDAELQRGLLVVALRAAMQDGNKAKARGLLDQLLEDSKNDKGGLQALAQLVAQLKKQIDKLKAKTDASSRAQLVSLVNNFTGFLDAMAKQPKLDPGMIFFLAESYSGVGDFNGRNLHADAAKLLDQIKEPKPMPGVPLDKKAEATYHYARLKLIQELRMARKFAEARKALADVANQSWGKGFSVMKERPLILMEEAKYGGAAVAWNKIIQSFGGSPNFNNAQIKENYFESYYQYIYCLFLYAKTATDPKIQAKAPGYIKRAANAIVKLEITPPGDMGGESFKKRYQELLNKEPLLKKEYEAIKKEKAAAPKAAATK